jgi:penicillin-binding protein 2
MGITPLQNANVATIIANKGWYYTPHIVKAIDGSTSDTLLNQFKVKHNTLITDSSIYNNVIEGMSHVTESGTAHLLKIEGVEYCAKTGTAENPHGRDHSVFVAFAPKNNPKIAIAVLVENAGWGASWAGPIATLMMEKYLNGKIVRKELEQKMMEADLINQPKYVKPAKKKK